MENRTDQRQELHKTIWAIANDLRGSVDGWDFKNYVLGFMFYRFISENLTKYLNKIQHEAGDIDFNYENIKDSDVTDEIKTFVVDSKGFFISPSDLFSNVKKLKDNDNINEKLREAFK